MATISQINLNGTAHTLPAFSGLSISKSSSHSPVVGSFIPSSGVSVSHSASSISFTLAANEASNQFGRDLSTVTISW